MKQTVIAFSNSNLSLRASWLELSPFEGNEHDCSEMGGGRWLHSQLLFNRAAAARFTFPLSIASFCTSVSSFEKQCVACSSAFCMHADSTALARSFATWQTAEATTDQSTML